MGGDPTPGKSQVIWVSLGNKQLDTPPSKKLVPPPGKCWTPGTLEQYSLKKRTLDVCKIG